LLAFRTYVREARSVSSLRSALDELEVEDPASLPDARLVEDFEEAQMAIERLRSRQLRLLAQIYRRRNWANDGFLSTAAWLVDRFRMSWSVAKTDVRTARALEEMPRTREALESGGISSCQIRVLAAARAAHPEDFLASEELLLGAAQRHSVRELTRVVAYWQNAVDSERGVDPSERAWNRRHLHVSPTLHGMVRWMGISIRRPGRRS